MIRANGTISVDSVSSDLAPMRIGTIHHVTGETDVRVSLGLDGTGRCQAATGMPILDHMLHQISSHGLIDLEISASGDTHIDDQITLMMAQLKTT